MRCLTLASGLVAAFIFLPSLARAQGAPAPVAIGAPQGGDTIYLKGGAVVRGTIGVAMPGSPITIQLPNGQVLTIQWDTVDHIDRLTTPAAQPRPQMAVVPQVLNAPPAAPIVVVHIESDDPGVVLQTQVPTYEGRGRWETVCMGPCDRPVPLGAMYRITGDGIRSSKPFEIGGQPGGRAQLVVATSSSSGFTTGIVLASAGGGAAVIGLSLTVLGLLVGTLCDFGKTCTGDVGLITAGLVTTGVGVVGMVAGIAMLGSNSRSKVQQVALGSPGPRGATWTWREAGLATPRTVGVPIFGASF